MKYSVTFSFDENGKIISVDCPFDLLKDKDKINEIHYYFINGAELKA